MSRSSSVRLVLLLAVMATIGIPLVGCGGGSSGGKSGTDADSDLAVTYFNLDRRTDVYRNGILRVDFSAPIRKSSLSNRTVRVLTGQSGSSPVPGALFVGGTYGLPGNLRTVYFDPTRSQAQLDRQDPNLATIVKDDSRLDPDSRDYDYRVVYIRPGLAFGFEPLASHRLYIPSLPTEKKVLLNKSGRPIVAEFVTSFQTGEDYVPELISPTFVGHDGSGELGFLPAPNEDGSIAYNADILIDFDEPIDPASMNPGVTVTVKNLSVLDYLGRPIDVPGTFKASDDGLQYAFSPSFHYGTGPYVIELAMSFEIRDLAGNPLANPEALRFTTEFNPNVDTISNLTESFDSKRYEAIVDDDGQLIVDRAEWNSEIEGRLVGGEITTSKVIVHYDGDNIQTRNLLVDFPLVSLTANSACPRAWADGCRVMMSYEAGDDLGNATGAVTKIYWGPASNALFGATHDNIQIRLGHNTAGGAVLGSKFDDNFAGGAPLPHYDGSYQIPQDANVNIPPGTLTEIENHWAWPTITNPFDYNGEDHLLVDFQMDAAPDCQTMRVFFHGSNWVPDYIGIRTLLGMKKAADTANVSYDTTYPDGYPMIYDTAFEFRRRVTNAQSKWYNTAQDMPNFGEPIVSPPVQEGGASYTIEFQGAHAMVHPDYDWLIIPDPYTFTSWSTSIDVADFHRYIRFRIKLQANLISETVPYFDMLQMPFSFRPN